MKPKKVDHETWLDLSAAADYLGVHFTTLRRWADAGEIAFIRTPGGRRRFSVKTLAQFVEQMRVSPALEQVEQPAGLTVQAGSPLQERAIGLAREHVRDLSNGGSWLSRLSEEQRHAMKGTGHRLTALMLQFNSRDDGGEAYLEEGCRIMRDYSQVCSSIGLSLTETVNVFLLFRRSILDAVHQTGYLGGAEDYEGQRIYHHTTVFLDQILVELISSYLQAPSHTYS